MKKNNVNEIAGINYYVSSVIDGSVGFKNETPKEEIIRNRKAISDKCHFGIDQIVSMQQAHTSYHFCVRNNDIGSGAKEWASGITNTDAIVTSEQGAVLLAISADCPLVLIANRSARAFAVVHSGWRGTVKGIVPNVLMAMDEVYKCNHDDTEIVLAPMAGKCCYEIQDDLCSQFLENFPRDVIVHNQDCLFLDLNKTIRYQVQRANINMTKIHDFEECTICNPDYYSYRRDGISAGRFGLFAWMN